MTRRRGGTAFSAEGGASLRYRRMQVRYVVVAGQPRQLGEPVFQTRAAVSLAQPRWRPPADLYETAGALTVTVDLAGITPEAVELLLFEDALVVDGWRRVPPAGADGFYHGAEIRQGPFRLEIALPVAVDPDRAEAHYERGLLLMTLPKREGNGRGR
jgi:HSP20 family protein